MHNYIKNKIIGKKEVFNFSIIERRVIMALMYLAKINLNSKIFEVYSNKLKIDDVLEIIYKRLSEDVKYINELKTNFIDSLGNSHAYTRISKYQFVELNKQMNNIITGKIVRTFNKPTEKYNEITKKMDQIYNEESVSIFFYFDVRREMITFCERQSFGYNQFMESFSALLEHSVPEYKFELFLQKDANVLEEKLMTFELVNRVKATLIPPNSNEEDLAELRATLTYLKQCEDVNANKLNIEMLTDKDSTLSMESKYMKDIFKAVKLGYGDVTASGKNKNGREQIVKSTTDAAYTRIVSDDLSTYDYEKESKEFIDIYFVGLMRVRTQN